MSEVKKKIVINHEHLNPNTHKRHKNGSNGSNGSNGLTFNTLNNPTIKSTTQRFPDCRTLRNFVANECIAITVSHKTT